MSVTVLFQIHECILFDQWGIGYLCLECFCYVALTLERNIPKISNKASELLIDSFPIEVATLVIMRTVSSIYCFSEDTEKKIEKEMLANFFITTLLFSRRQNIVGDVYSSETQKI